MNDLISRQAAIDALGGNEPVGDPSKMDDDDVVKMWERIRIINIINKLPSAQLEHLTDDDFETIRIHLNALKEKLCNQRRWKEAEEYQRIIDRFMSFASAQPEIIRCRNCKFASGDSRICMKFGHSPIGELDFCAWAEGRC